MGATKLLPTVLRWFGLVVCLAVTASAGLLPWYGYRYAHSPCKLDALSTALVATPLTAAVWVVVSAAVWSARGLRGMLPARTDLAIWAICLAATLACYLATKALPPVPWECSLF
jgi:hypothetical protein